MRRNTSAKIAQQHSQTEPGWVVSNGTPAEWSERVIKPLLADLTTPPPRFSLGRDEPPAPTHRVDRLMGAKVRFIGWIKLAVQAKSDDYYQRPYYGGWQRELMVPLYWVVGPGGGDHQVAIAPARISQYDYYHTIDQLSELRYLAGPEALRALLQALLAQLQEQVFKDQKTNKVRKLQTQAVEAQIRQLANEERFAYQVSTTARLIRIAVRLDEINQLTISVPFSEFENVLPQLRETVINLRALHQRRIHFRTHQVAYGSRSWIEPDPVAAVNPAS